MILKKINSKHLVVLLCVIAAAYTLAVYSCILILNSSLPSELKYILGIIPFHLSTILIIIITWLGFKTPSDQAKILSLSPMGQCNKKPRPELGVILINIITGFSFYAIYMIADSGMAQNLKWLILTTVFLFHIIAVVKIEALPQHLTRSFTEAFRKIDSTHFLALLLIMMAGYALAAYLCVLILKSGISPDQKGSMGMVFGFFPLFLPFVCFGYKGLSDQAKIQSLIPEYLNRKKNRQGLRRLLLIILTVISYFVIYIVIALSQSQNLKATILAMTSLFYFIAISKIRKEKQMKFEPTGQP